MYIRNGLCQDSEKLKSRHCVKALQIILSANNRFMAGTFLTMKFRDRGGNYRLCTPSYLSSSHMLQRNAQGPLCVATPYLISNLFLKENSLKSFGCGWHLSLSHVSSYGRNSEKISLLAVDFCAIFLAMSSERRLISTFQARKMKRNLALGLVVICFKFFNKDRFSSQVAAARPGR